MISESEFLDGAEDRVDDLGVIDALMLTGREECSFEEDEDEDEEEEGGSREESRWERPGLVWSEMFGIEVRAVVKDRGRWGLGARFFELR